jgi:hypothetical protein
MICSKMVQDCPGETRFDLYELVYCHDNEDAESTAKTEHFNNSQEHAHYLHVVKCKTNIVKFAYHKSYQLDYVCHMVTTLIWNVY